ncbi:MAG TPA: hypothetical protein VGR72_00565 [Candidatus Acidoferrales bacterium]|nr:hypothetical protein [Candidatus Acidoferrales bacterium]
MRLSRTSGWRGWRVPDWAQRLREQLAGMRLGLEQHEEIVTELAGHLEDVYENLSEQGICAEKAEEQAWREVSSGRELARKIRRAKQGEESMSNRMKQIWLPGCVISGLAMSWPAIFQHEGVRLAVLGIPADSSLLLYVAWQLYLPWLLTLPIFGFAGAYWSRRAGGGRGAQIVVGTSPAFTLLIVLLLILPVAMVVDRHGVTILAVESFLLAWAVVPAAALLLGALPAALLARKSLEPSQAAIRQ